MPTSAAARTLDPDRPRLRIRAGRPPKPRLRLGRDAARVSALQWACHLRSTRHIQAVERGVDPVEVLRSLQVQLAVVLAAGEEQLERRVLDPHAHVDYHELIKIMRTMVRLTLDMMVLDTYRGCDVTSTVSLPSSSIQNGSHSRSRFKNRR